MALARFKPEDPVTVEVVPERRLLAAILARAALDIAQDREREEALTWLMNDEQTELRPYAAKTGFDFVEICEALDLDPRTTRAIILESMN